MVVGCGLAGAAISVRDAEQRAQDAFDQPIPRLYVAAEIGSIFGHLYLEAGKTTECFIRGSIPPSPGMTPKIPLIVLHRIA